MGKAVSDRVIWVMDSDICDRCNGMLGDFGMCENCGWDGISEDEWDDWDREEGDGYNDDCDEMGEYDT